mmetsp:Transcript_5545/g.5726  ORF Transcript_5545/g.5726 Transcript_5545/m.5726 type:complete len:254 (+) Transcript_5545:107-868(+)|eukprot:CAMPEP_0182427434 /NCGR_PEP_ID=MMETSP1167-20130531/17171_1 /TAXON_ID=2988 /ORGANISM="Mallomonas Sp, Strain CCMP3275" /LENGTH=253 /DNA_ID=CAMNT_0024609663 /DNA_START=82 /DNA_END=843 /DNA_ORIENTATION=+
MYAEAIDLTLAAQAFFTFCYLISSFVVGGNYYGGFIAVFTGLLYATSIGITYYGIRHKPSRMMYGSVLGAGTMLIFTSLMAAVFWGQYAECQTLSAAGASVINPNYVPPPTSSPTMYPTVYEEDEDADEDKERRLRRLSELLGHAANSVISTIDSESNHLLSVFKSRKLSDVECAQTSAMRSVCAFSVFMFLSYIVLLSLLIKFKTEILATVPPEADFAAAGQAPYRGGANPTFNAMQPSPDAARASYISADL